MFAEKLSIALSTNGSGAATAYSDPIPHGRVLTVRYVKTDFADGSTITITVDGTGEAILTLTAQNTSGVFYPRVQVHDETGTGATLDGTRKLREPVLVVADKVKVVVASGGASKTGTIILSIG